MPVYEWDKCGAGQLHFVHKKRRHSRKNAARFEALQDQYFQRYGFGEGLEAHLEVKKLLTELRLDYVQTGERMLLNQIAIEEKNLLMTNPSGFEGMDTDQVIAHLFLSKGARIDKRVVSVVEFRAILDQYKLMNKAA